MNSIDFWDVVSDEMKQKMKTELQSNKGILFLGINSDNNIEIYLDYDTAWNHEGVYTSLGTIINETGELTLGDISLINGKYRLNDWSKQDLYQTWEERGHQINTDIVSLGSNLYNISSDLKIKRNGTEVLDLLKINCTN